MALDDTLDAVDSGQTARLVRGTTEEWLIGQEEDMIQSLVNKYRSGTLTDFDLRGSIGEIAGLRRFREHLETTIRIGVLEAEKELGQDG